MAGYNYAEGMSNNAVAAYRSGLFPLSRLTRDDLRNVGVSLSKSFAVWLAKKGHWQPAEWHHSGGTWYTEVYFYDVQMLADMIAAEDLDLPTLEAAYRAERAATVIEMAVTGRYPVWGGSRRHPRIEGYVNFRGVKRGNWIILDDGTRKKADGKYIEWQPAEKS